MFRFSVILVLTIFGQLTFADEPEMIVGGSVVKPGEFPYQCTINYNDGSFCGCSIINDMQVLTAAHCVDQLEIYPNYEPISIGTGSIYAAEGDKHAIRKIRSHPDYKEGSINSWKNDIAVITLKEPIKYNKYQCPIRLAITPFRIGTRCTLSGWGNIRRGGPDSKSLLKMNTKLIDKEVCQNKYPDVPLLETNVCAFNKLGIGACSGDSGGPLVCNGVQVGVASFSRPCALGTPDVFTDVSYYQDFIREAKSDAYRFY